MDSLKRPIAMIDWWVHNVKVNNLWLHIYLARDVFCIFWNSNISLPISQFTRPSINRHVCNFVPILKQFSWLEREFLIQIQCEIILTWDISIRDLVHSYWQWHLINKLFYSLLMMSSLLELGCRFLMSWSKILFSL